MGIVDQSNAIVDPLAMMVELDRATIARRAVLAIVQNVRFTHIAVQVALVFVE